MDSYQLTSYIRKVISKTEENSIVRKFLDSAFINDQSSDKRLNKGNQLSPNNDNANDNNVNKNESNTDSLYSTNDNCGNNKKRVSLNLSDNQIYDNDSHRYLTPIANPKFLLTTKKFNLPECKKAHVITINNNNLNDKNDQSVSRGIDKEFRTSSPIGNRNTLSVDGDDDSDTKGNFKFPNGGKYEKNFNVRDKKYKKHTTKKYHENLAKFNKENCNTNPNDNLRTINRYSFKRFENENFCILSKESGFPSYESIKDCNLSLNDHEEESKDKDQMGSNKKNVKDETFTVDETFDQSKTSIKGILKMSKQSISDTSTSTYKTFSPTNKSINEKFVVNLYESRASKRWKHTEKTKKISNTDNSILSSIKSTPEIVKFTKRIDGSDNLLNIISNSTIHDMIKDLQRNIDGNLKENVSHGTFSFSNDTFPSENISKNFYESTSNCNLDDSDCNLSVDNLVTKYENEYDIQSQIMIETTKILLECRKLKQFYGSMVHVEAEKILLLANLKYNQILEKLLSNDLRNQPKVATGTIVISNIRFPMQNVKAKTKLPKWFICVVSTKDKLKASKLSSLSFKNYIDINDEFSFNNLDWNFEINIDLYCLEFAKLPKNKCFSKKHQEEEQFSRTLKHKDLKTNTIRDDYVTNTSFKLCANAKINLKDVKHNQIVNLITHCDWLESKIYLDLQLQNVKFYKKWSGFLSIGKERIGKIFWNRRWCTIDGYNIIFYNYPCEVNYNNPIDIINLKNILYPYLIKARKNVCMRSRTVVLHIGKARRRHKVYISADTNEDLDEFKNIVEEIIMYLKYWNLQTYSDS